jgi:hypothetical protein
MSQNSEQEYKKRIMQGTLIESENVDQIDKKKSVTFNSPSGVSELSSFDSRSLLVEKFNSVSKMINQQVDAEDTWLEYEYCGNLKLSDSLYSI